MTTATAPIDVRELYQCPGCGGSLKSHDEQKTACVICGYPIRIRPDGVWHVGHLAFDDHWAATPEKRAHFEKVHMPREEHHNVRFTRDFTIPLLRRLFGERRDVRILSCGCGLGYDVDLLNSEGYEVWGNDLGNRADYWKTRSSAGRFVQCAAEELPFPDSYFDLIQSHLVLEHVGVVGDTLITKPDYWEIRKKFLHSMIRKVKKGGYVNVSTPNRTFPIDPGHAEGTKLGMRIHGPFDRFLTSYGDMRAYCPGHQIIPVSPKGYYAGACVGRIGGAKDLFAAYLNALDKLPFLQGTFLNPLMNCLIRRQT